MEEYSKIGRLQHAKASAARQLANHRVHQKHRDGDVVRLWRCDNDGSAIYHFYVLASPGWLMFYGDMGECMWSRATDMIEFARGSINSLDYFSEKASRNCIIKEECPEMIGEYLDGLEQDHEDNHGEPMSDDLKDEIEDLRRCGTVQQFCEQFYTSGLYHGEMPDFRFYTYNYLWKIEALKWFVAKLDAGEVTPTPAPAEASSPADVQSRPGGGGDCTWTEQDSHAMCGVWFSGCGQAWELTNGTPNDNGMRFCPFCGGAICSSAKS